MLPPVNNVTHSVQDFPPPNTMGGAWFTEYKRGPYLPVRGSKERDRILRLYDHDENNTLWQGARSGFSKKVASVQYSIEGDSDTEVQYYQDLLGNAHFGRGWQHFIKLMIRDYLTQSYGAVVEIVGYGDEWEPLPEGLPILGVNHLDSGCCYFTGNPIYPVVYYSLWDGRLHRMHADRVYILVDDPDPDERYLGIGTCALERAIAVVQREIRMAQYIDTKLDDKPNPGILALGGLGEAQWDQAVTKYIMQQSNDARPVFGRTMIIGNTNKEIDIKSIPFSEPPEKFDWIQYTNTDVDMLCAAFGMDRQELWQLTGGNIGSSAQSEVLAEKSRGKTFGDFLAALERFLNWSILPVSLEAKLKDDDERKRKAQAEIDEKYASIASTLAALPGVSAEMVLKVMVNASDTFKNVFTNDKGQIVLPIADPQTLQQSTTLDEVKPVAPEQSAVAETAADESTATGDTPIQKAYSSTAVTFKMRFTDIVSNAVAKVITPTEFDTLMLALLERSGRNALLDGLKQGGVSEIDETDEFELSNWLIKQIDFIDKLKREVYAGTLQQTQIPMRSDMWSNVSLKDAYNIGVLSADKNGMYEWIYDHDVKQHCPDCKRLNQQRHRFLEWNRRNWLPTSHRLECGLACKCKLVKTTLPAQGRF